HVLATSLIYTLSLHDALPISSVGMIAWWSDTCALFTTDFGSLKLLRASLLATAAYASTPHASSRSFNVGTMSVVMTRESVLGYRSEEHTSELQSRFDLVCRLL